MTLIENGTNYIIDVNSSDFMMEVVEASKTQPVIVDFWAPWCGPCKQLMPILEQCVTAAQGKVKLAKVNIDENQAIAAQLRVQSVPTVYAFIDGQPVDGFAGAQPESEIKDFISRLLAQAGGIDAKIEMLVEEAENALADKNYEQANMCFGQVLELDETSDIAFAGILRCLTGLGQFDDARAMLGAMTEEMQEKDTVQKALKALEVAEGAFAASGQLSQLEAAISESPEDPELLFNLAVAKFGSGDSAAAINTLLRLIALNREWNDDQGRRKLLEIFDVLGATSPEVIRGRRQLSSLLFR